MTREGWERKGELVFTFDDDSEISIQIQNESVGEWRILPAVSPCKVYNKLIVLQ